MSYFDQVKPIEDAFKALPRDMQGTVLKMLTNWYIDEAAKK